MTTHDFTTRRRVLGGLGAAFMLTAVNAAFGRPAASGAPAFALAGELSPGTDPAGYLVSEKFDGVRAQWDGTRLWFRSGRVVQAPAWFLARLPAQPLDGELWLGRGRFDALSGIVRKERADDESWRQVRYLVFEWPGGAGPFAERAARIRQVVDAAGWPALIAVEQARVADRAALQARLAEVVRGGGEGLVLHRADAPYRTGRSDALLKLKPLNDAEALVIAHVAGQGKYRGQLGTLQVRLPDGKTLLIGTGFSDADRAEPPSIGSTVTYTHRGLTGTGLPRFASFLRVHEAP